MRSKVVTKEEALKAFKDGQTIMFGDWHGELSAEEKDKLVVNVSGSIEYRYYEGKVSYQKNITRKNKN